MPGYTFRGPRCHLAEALAGSGFLKREAQTQLAVTPMPLSHSNIPSTHPSMTGFFLPAELIPLL